jgi:hypothetical protein
VLALSLSLCVASAAAASDGRVEVDQICAVSTGCMAGDGPGFPVTITGAGGRSFVLTSDLVVPGTDVDGIQVLASDVSIDLNDHTILRSECVGATSNCSGGATDAIGIRDVTSTSPVGGVVVHDGTILGFNEGLSIGRAGELRNVAARWNADGLRSHGRGALLFGNLAESNAQVGIRSGLVEPGCVLVGNRTVQNDGSSLVVTLPGFVAADNVAFENGLTGFHFNRAGVYVDNVAYGNGSIGMTVRGGAVVHRNSAVDNDFANFLISGPTLVRGNVARGSAGTGIIVSSDGQGLLENVVGSNAGGDVSGIGLWVDLGANACGGTPGCP